MAFDRGDGVTGSGTAPTLQIVGGGTGATNAADALTNLGAYPASNPNGYTNNTGTVTSVAVSVPTGLSVSGSPVTTNGTVAITYSSGYAIPTTAKQTEWDSAYSWGDHALAGYLESSDIGTTVQGYSSVLANTTASFTTALETKVNGIEAGADVTDATNVEAAGAVMDTDFSTNGLMKRTGAGAYSVVTDNSSNWDTAYGWGNHASAGYLDSADIGTTVQGYSSVLANTTASFTTSLETKLNGIEAGAEVNVNADWNASSGDAQILNKPTLATVATSGSYNDLTDKPSIPAAYTNSDVDAHLNTGTATTGEVLSWNGSDYDWVAAGAGDVTLNGTQTLTNKTLTNPTINGFTGDTSVVNIGSGQIYKDTSGNVGIGTSSPLSKLNVALSSTDTVNYYNGSRLTITNSNTTANNFDTLSFTTANGNDAAAIWTIIGSHTVSAATGTLVFGTTNASSVSTERMRIDSSGNVGIGTSSPAQKLDVSGSIKWSGATYENVFTITDGASVDLDPANGTVQLWTLGANRTPTATNFAAGQSMTLMINDGTARTITWTTIGVVWVGGTAPTLATSGYTVIELWEVGTTIYGALVGSVA
jgi:hypothetical protein